MIHVGLNPWRRGAVAATVTLALASTVWAHDDSVLDLEALEAHVAAKVVETQNAGKSLRKAYAKLDRKLQKPSTNRLANDVTKVGVAAKLTRTKLVADVELRELVDTALDAADEALVRAPDFVAHAVQQIGKDARRRKPEKHALRARTHHLAGRTARAVQDEPDTLKRFKKAAVLYAKARKAADKAVVRQGSGDEF